MNKYDEELLAFNKIYDLCISYGHTEESAKNLTKSYIELRSKYPKMDIIIPKVDKNTGNWVYPREPWED